MTPPKRFSNRDVADALRTIGDIFLIKGENRFRVLAFQNAAESIQNLGQDIYAIYAAGELQSIPNVGKSIAADISQLLETGQIAYLEELKQEVPLGVVEMMRVPDMGPKKAARLWQELGVASIAELKAAAQAGKLRNLPGFGVKSEEKILKGIELLETRKDERTPLGVARPTVLDSHRWPALGLASGRSRSGGAGGECAPLEGNRGRPRPAGHAGAGRRPPGCDDSFPRSAGSSRDAGEWTHQDARASGQRPGV